HHVHALLSGGDAVERVVTGRVVSPGCRQEVLGGHAAGVHAGASHGPSLHQGHAGTEIRGPDGRGERGSAGADGNQVVVSDRSPHATSPHPCRSRSSVPCTGRSPSRHLVSFDSDPVGTDALTGCKM